MIKDLEKTFPFTPIIVIGAGRSGTNALRDSLTRFNGFSTWPCDEINPIWRHGNLDWPDDAIPVQCATPKVRGSIRGAFWKIWRQQGFPDFVIEKTCANALRIPFVDAILPEARYVHIVRNGFDIMASAQKRWRGELEIPAFPYYLSKARYAPLSDLPKYAFTALRNQVAIRLGRRTHLNWWGPRFTGFAEFSNACLDEIVARQWVNCVISSDESFSKIGRDRTFYLRYEDFINDPKNSLVRLTKWLKVPFDEKSIAFAASSVRQASAKQGQTSSKNFSKKINALLDPVMRAHGYLE